MNSDFDQLVSILNQRKINQIIFYDHGISHFVGIDNNIITFRFLFSRERKYTYMYIETYIGKKYIEKKKKKRGCRVVRVCPAKMIVF